MHELGLAQGLLDTALAHPAVANTNRIVRLDLRIGVLAGVVADSLTFCFDLLSQGTPAQGAELRIVSAPARARCRACGTERELQVPDGSPSVAIFYPKVAGTCACGDEAFDLVGGHEMTLVEMEVLSPEG